jgi:hypothetical protein
MPSIQLYKIAIVALTMALLSLLLPAHPLSAAASKSVTIIKLAVDGVTINRQVRLTYQEMRDTLPVQGDNKTHYYHQGPVFVDDVEARWNPTEDTNYENYDYGALKGTLISDLCEEVGGMQEGEEVVIKASDGMSKIFAYKNVYENSTREGPIVLTWFKDGMYPDSGYEEGMRIVWFADTSVNPDGWHVFGVSDWRQAAEEQYWYYFVQDKKKYPTTTGLSVKYVNQITILSNDAPYWDLNKDKVGNIGDIKAVWIAEDVNRDGEVNILDVVKLGMNWGKSY